MAHLLTDNTISFSCLKAPSLTVSPFAHLQAQQQQQSRTSEEVNTSLFNKDVTFKAPLASKDLENIDWPATDHLANPGSDLLNAQVPPMSVPGAMPRRQSDFFRNSGQQQRPAYDWKDIVIATATYGSAAVGFAVIMCDGARTIGGFLAEAGADLLNEIMGRLGV